MDVEIVQNGIDCLCFLRDPSVDALQELDPIGHGASRIGLREGLARGGSKGPKDIALASPTRINLLPSAFAGVGGSGTAAGRTSAWPGKLFADSGPI